jgi:hypothetical protein
MQPRSDVTRRGLGRINIKGHHGHDKLRISHHIEPSLLPAIFLTMTEVHIEVDLEETSDEDYQSGGESSTASLSSTIFSYEYENGRRYHAYKAGAYALPNDETEQDRLVPIHEEGF